MGARARMFSLADWTYYRLKLAGRSHGFDARLSMEG